MSNTVAADVRVLYQAGREIFPERAERLSGACFAASDVVNPVNAESACVGDRAALANAVEVWKPIFERGPRSSHVRCQPHPGQSLLLGLGRSSVIPAPYAVSVRPKPTDARAQASCERQVTQ